MNRICSIGKRILPVVLVLLMAMSGETSAISISSTFDTDDEGWTVTAGATSHQLSGGNPGGYLLFTDTAGGNYSGFAPAKFLGDLSAFDGGVISFDAKAILVQNPTFGQEFGVIEIYSGTDFVRRDLAPDPPPWPNPVWTTYSRPMTASAWGESQTDWLALLGNVTKIRVVLEAYNDIDKTGFDNFEISGADPIPEPSTMLLLGTGLVGLFGYGWRRRKQMKN